MKQYVISIDQSTQQTKAFLFDSKGTMIRKAGIPHEQIINELGWVSHDPEEIYKNTVKAVTQVVKESGIDPEEVASIGISNQRETSVIWDRESAKPLHNAVVWQCARAAQICEREEIKDHAELIREKTGLYLSPYYPASKYAWLLENTDTDETSDIKNRICLGTIDAFLVYKLTEGKVFATDFSNASRTQLLNIRELIWDKDVCGFFGIPQECLPEIRNSNSEFGTTTCEGLFSTPVPISAVLGDSHAALFAQNCVNAGDTKATFGTGTSVMMNIGFEPVLSKNGLSTSLAWKIGDKAEYALEGNINYSGAIIVWLKNNLKLFEKDAETESLAIEANKNDSLYLVPAFTGLGAPYWNSDVKAAFVGIDRTTGRAEMVRAGLEAIAYQIADVIGAMEKDMSGKLGKLKVDGGATSNNYLMQFQSDISDCEISISENGELSGTGAAALAGITAGVWGMEVLDSFERREVHPQMDPFVREQKFKGYKEAVKTILRG